MPEYSGPRSSGGTTAGNPTASLGDGVKGQLQRVVVAYLDDLEAGRRLGVATPRDDIIRAARVGDAATVSLTVSGASVRATVEPQVARLREGLPERPELWIDGTATGALSSLPAGTTVLISLNELGRRLVHLTPIELS